MKKNTNAILSGLVVAAMMLAGCGSNETAATSAASSEAQNESTETLSDETLSTTETGSADTENSLDESAMDLEYAEGFQVYLRQEILMLAMRKALLYR